MKKKVVHLLFSMFQNKELYSVMSYENLDDFYAEIGYGLESELILLELNVQGTSDLQDLFMDYELNLDNKMSDEEFEKKWLV